MAIEHLPATATGDDVAGVLARDGVAVVDRLVAPEVIDRAKLSYSRTSTPPPRAPTTSRAVTRDAREA